VIFPTRKYCLEYDVFISINYKRHYICIVFEWNKGYHLTSTRWMFKNCHIFLLQNQLGDFFKRDVAICNKSFVFLFVPDNVHDEIYHIMYTMSINLLPRVYSSSECCEDLLVCRSTSAELACGEIILSLRSRRKSGAATSLFLFPRLHCACPLKH
jgi:hypothetical protein